MPCLCLRHDSMMFKIVHEILLVSRFASHQLTRSGRENPDVVVHGQIPKLSLEGTTLAVPLVVKE